MNKPKQHQTHQSVKLPSQLLNSVRNRVAVTKQSISGFIEIAIHEKLTNDLGPSTSRVGPREFKEDTVVRKPAEIVQK